VVVVVVCGLVVVVVVVVGVAMTCKVKGSSMPGQTCVQEYRPTKQHSRKRAAKRMVGCHWHAWHLKQHCWLHVCQWIYANACMPWLPAAAVLVLGECTKAVY
jgi:hypothetical protein